MRAECGRRGGLCTGGALRGVAARMNAAVAELSSTRPVDSVLRKRESKRMDAPMSVEAGLCRGGGALQRRQRVAQFKARYYYL